MTLFAISNINQSSSITLHLRSSLFYLCSSVFYLCSLVFHLCSLLFICVPLVFHLCSTCVLLVFHLCSLMFTCVLLVFTCVHLCSTCVHLCSFVFHLYDVLDKTRLQGALLRLQHCVIESSVNSTAAPFSLPPVIIFNCLLALFTVS